MKRIFIVLFLTITLMLPTLVLFSPSHALAADEPIAGKEGLLSNLSKDCYALGNCELCDVVHVVDNVIQLILGLVGSVALLFFIYGGFQILVGGKMSIGSGDQKQSVQKGKKTIEAAVIGMFLVFFSFAIVNFTLNIIVGNANSSDPTKKYGVAEVFGQKWVDLCPVTNTATTPQ